MLLQFGFGNPKDTPRAASPPVVTDSGADGGKQPESLRHRGLGGRRSHFCEGHPGECETCMLINGGLVAHGCTGAAVTCSPGGCPMERKLTTVQPQVLTTVPTPSLALVVKNRHHPVGFLLHVSLYISALQFFLDFKLRYFPIQT